MYKGELAGTSKSLLSSSASSSPLIYTIFCQKTETSIPPFLDSQLFPICSSPSSSPHSWLPRPSPETSPGTLPSTMTQITKAQPISRIVGTMKHAVRVVASNTNARLLTRSREPQRKRRPSEFCLATWRPLHLLLFVSLQFVVSAIL